MTLKKKKHGMDFQPQKSMEPRKTFGTKPKKILNDTKYREALDEIEEYTYGHEHQELPELPALHHGTKH